MDILLASLAVMVGFVSTITLIGISFLWLISLIKKASDNLSHDILDTDTTYDE